MFGMGAPELLIILVIVVLLFGAAKIPGAREEHRGRPEQLQARAEGGREARRRPREARRAASGGAAPPDLHERRQALGLTRVTAEDAVEREADGAPVGDETARCGGGPGRRA